MPILRILSCISEANHDILSAKGGLDMTARERILALRLLEKQEKHPEYTGRIGVRVCVIHHDGKERKKNHV